MVQNGEYMGNDIGLYIFLAIMTIIAILHSIVIWFTNNKGIYHKSDPNDDFQLKLKMNRMTEQYSWDHYERLKKDPNKD